MISKKDVSDKLKNAMVKRDNLAISLFREIKTAITNFESSNNRKEIDNESLLKLVQTIKKQHEESKEACDRANRYREVETENTIINIIDYILPEEASVSELDVEVNKVIDSIDEEITKKHMGLIIKQVKENFKTKLIDGKKLSDVVKKYLK